MWRSAPLQTKKQSLGSSDGTSHFLLDKSSGKKQVASKYENMFHIWNLLIGSTCNQKRSHPLARKRAGSRVALHPLTVAKPFLLLKGGAR